VIQLSAWNAPAVHRSVEKLLRVVTGACESFNGAMQATSHATSTIGSLPIAHNTGVEGETHSTLLHACSSCLALTTHHDTHL
jgi:hypothetical protein